MLGHESKEFVNMLKNSTVRDEIISIILEAQRDADYTAGKIYGNINEKKIPELELKVQELEERVASLTEQCARHETKEKDLKSKLDQAVSEANRLENKCAHEAEEKSKLEKSCIEYERKYSQYEQILKLLDLSTSETRNYLSSLMIHNSLENIIGLGVNKENLKCLWDFVKYKAVERDDKDMEMLRLLLSVSFDIYNKVNENPDIKLYSPSIGEYVDMNTASIIGAAGCGVVSKVIMPGYVNPRNNQIYKKSIVEVTQ